MTPSTFAPAVSAPPPGVETMGWPELAGYLAAIISGARIYLEHGFADQALAELRQAEAVKARHTRHALRKGGGQ